MLSHEQEMEALRKQHLMLENAYNELKRKHARLNKRYTALCVKLCRQEDYMQAVISKDTLISKDLTLWTLFLIKLSLSLSLSLYTQTHTHTPGPLPVDLKRVYEAPFLERPAAARAGF